jgi:DNA transformation protein and related proteins
MARKPLPALMVHVLDVIQDALALQGRASVPVAGAMFGGWSIKVRGDMLALVINERVYLKTTENNRARFVSEGCEPFSYDRKDGKTVVVASYYEPPAQALDSAHDFAPWLAAALNG